MSHNRAGRSEDTVTIRDVAREADVSVATVSRVLNKTDYPVRESTRQRVLDAIESLGFLPNELARGLLNRRTNTIGLVIPDISNPYYPELARGIEDAASTASQAVILCNTDYDVDKTQTYLNVLLQRRVDGLIIAFGTSAFTEGWGIVDKLNTKVVTISRHHGLPYPTVSVDNVSGGAQAGEHLVALGHKRIAFLAGPMRSIAVQDRLAGLTRILRQNHIDWDQDRLLVEAGGTGQTAGYELTQSLLNGDAMPTALLAFNDRMAIGAMAAASDAGLRIPHDISVMGFDDAKPASFVRPALTTVTLHAYDLGSTAMKLLLKLIAEDRTEAEDIWMPTELVVRGSTGPVN